MLWNHYVFREGNGVYELWDQLFTEKSVDLLYISGKGFDVRAQSSLNHFVDNLKESNQSIVNAELVLLGFPDYKLDPELAALTEENAEALKKIFSGVGKTDTIEISSTVNGEDDVSASVALSSGIRQVLAKIKNQTDIILDVSSLPRVVYLALLTNLLNKLVSKKSNSEIQKSPLEANGINFQVLVAEDPELDGKIKAEDPSNDLVLIPGFTGALHLEGSNDWPTVWFPILGENRGGQLQKIMSLVEIPASAEVCPVLPHPSKNPRRADDLLIEFREPLFESRQTPTTNILHVNEANPFEVYRQLLGAMDRYVKSMRILGGCSLIVTPLGSKLITIGAGLACFEMRPIESNADYAVAIPYAESKRYAASKTDLQSSIPRLSVLLLTGDAYKP